MTIETVNLVWMGVLMLVIYLAIVLWCDYTGELRKRRADIFEAAANDKFVCKQIAIALEIEAPGEKVEQYVQWALQERNRWLNQPMARK